MKKAAFVVLSIILMACAYIYLTPRKLTDGEKRAIVKLETMDGRFFCTGFVVSPKRIITAGHCVAGRDGDLVKVKNHQGLDLKVVAIPAKINERADHAVLEVVLGTLKQPALNYMQDANEIWKRFTSSNSKLACGFPYGGELVCSPITNAGFYNFFVKATGYLYPGMSGGPVLDTSDKQAMVIGLNTGVTDDFVILAPLVAIMAGLSL